MVSPNTNILVCVIFLLGKRDLSKSLNRISLYLWPYIYYIIKREAIFWSSYRAIPEVLPNRFAWFFQTTFNILNYEIIKYYYLYIIVIFLCKIKIKTIKSIEFIQWKKRKMLCLLNLGKVYQPNRVELQMTYTCIFYVIRNHILCSVIEQLFCGNLSDKNQKLKCTI